MPENLVKILLVVSMALEMDKIWDRAGYTDTDEVRNILK